MTSFAKLQQICTTNQWTLHRIDLPAGAGDHDFRARASLTMYTAKYRSTSVTCDTLDQAAVVCIDSLHRDGKNVSTPSAPVAGAFGRLQKIVSSNKKYRLDVTVTPPLTGQLTPSVKLVVELTDPAHGYLGTTSSVADTADQAADDMLKQLFDFGYVHVL